MLDRQFLHGDFEPHVGSDFLLTTPEIPSTTLTLVEAKALQVRPGGEHIRPPFALLFEGGEPVLEQRLHEFRHDAMGELTLFLVPIAKTSSGYQYEALFN